MAATSELLIGFFFYTPKELWEEVEQLVDTANQNYHEVLSGKNAEGSS